jgi:hypothetical protein
MTFKAENEKEALQSYAELNQTQVQKGKNK